jgi:hypothetical protein
MNTANCNHSDWDELLERIESRTIIPVIGQGLYWIEKNRQVKEGLLYDFMAEKLAEKVDYKLPQGVNHKFSKAAFQFLREKEEKGKSHFKAMKELNEFLRDILATVKLVPDNPLLKLARIKSFNLFINTTHDDFLVSRLKIARNHRCCFLNYTLKDKKLPQLKDELFDNLEGSQCTLVYNIYGNLRRRIDSAFTERDILETIVSFHRDMEGNPTNRLSQKLKSNSLLFIGCGYDDWLFRFFIRAVSNRSFKTLGPGNEDMELKFVSDVVDPLDELPLFLKSYDSKIFYSCHGKAFVDTLFARLARRFPGEIIPVSEFPGTAFISFTGEDRPAALQLASKLREGGIKVWVDVNEFKPGDKIDSTIKNAAANCPVFIPLISEKSKKLFLDRGEPKYHYQEWQWALLLNETEDNLPKIIIPVIIDDTDWMYRPFREYSYVKIPGGEGGEYERLEKRLSELQLSPGV